MKEFIVKVRGRQGTNSMDLTLPTEIRKEYDISPGDVFKVTVKNNKEELDITYSLVYKKERLK